MRSYTRIMALLSALALTIAITNKALFAAYPAAAAATASPLPAPYAGGPSIPRAHLFKHCLGADETSYVHPDKKKLDEYLDANCDEYDDPSWVAMSFKQVQADLEKKGFKPGIFTLKSVQELRTTVSRMRRTGGGTLKLVTYDLKNEASDEARSQVDIGAVQAHIAQVLNDTTILGKGLPTVQVASRMHCLEGASNRRLKNPSNIIEHHAVQGEEAAISTFPATLARMYDYTDAQSNLLKTLGITITPDGSVAPTHANAKIFDAIAEAYGTPAEHEWIGKVSVGVHRGAQVITGFANINRTTFTNTFKTACKTCNTPPGAPHLGTCRINNIKDSNALITGKPVGINHILCAALDLGTDKATGLPRHTYASDPRNNAACARIILKGMYEGTILSAIQNQSKDVYLTLVGGGAFRNDPLWIAEAITRMYAIIQEYGLNVTVFFFHDDALTPANRMFPAYQMLRGIAAQEIIVKAGAHGAAAAHAGAPLAAAAAGSPKRGRVSPDLRHDEVLDFNRKTMQLGWDSDDTLCIQTKQAFYKVIPETSDRTPATSVTQFRVLPEGLSYTKACEAERITKGYFAGKDAATRRPYAKNDKGETFGWSERFNKFARWYGSTQTWEGQKR